MSLRPYGHHRHRITANLSDEQFQHLSDLSQHFQCRKSALLRDAAFAYLHRLPVETPEVRQHRQEVLKQVVGIARNLNQLTRHLHTVGQVRGDDLQELQRYVASLVNWLR